MLAERRVKPRLQTTRAKDGEQQRVDDAKAHDQRKDEQRAVGREGREFQTDTTKRRARGCAARMSQPACQSNTTRPELPVIMTSKPFRKSRYEKWWVMTGLMSRPLSSITFILYQVSYISRP